MQNSNSSYTFLSDFEPTDNQLHLLMQDVLKEVKEKADKTNHMFWNQLNLLVQESKQNHPKLNL